MALPLVHTILHSLGSARSRLRPIFHDWKYSGVVIPAAFGAGVGLALGNKFGMAYVFFAIFGIWTLGYWLTNAWLARKRSYLATGAAKRDAKTFAVESRKYCAWQCGMSSLIVVSTGLCIMWTIATKRRYERDDVFRHLEFKHYFEPGAQDDPMFTHFTVTNNSGFVISKNHQLTCLTVLSVGNVGTSFVANIMSSQIGETTLKGGHPIGFGRTPSKDLLYGGGDSESGQCLKFYGFVDEGTDCADVILIFWYQLENQPGTDQEKRLRLVAYKGRNGQFEWYPQPIEHQGNYCRSFLKPGAPIQGAPI